MNCGSLYCFTLWCSLLKLQKRYNNLNARVSQCLQSWLGSWASTRAWWLFSPWHAMNCSFGKKEILPVVPSQCEPENEEGGPRDAVQEWDLCFPAFPAGCCGFAGVRWPEGCTGRISPFSWQKWGMLVSAPSGKGRLGWSVQSVLNWCKERCWNDHWSSKLLLPLSPDH